MLRWVFGWRMVSKGEPKGDELLGCDVEELRECFEVVDDRHGEEVGAEREDVPGLGCED